MSSKLTVEINGRELANPLWALLRIAGAMCWLALAVSVMFFGNTLAPWLVVIACLCAAMYLVTSR